MLLNCVISGAKHGAKFMACDIKDFFLATPMQKAEYMKIPFPFQYFPEDIITRSSLREVLASDGYIYIKMKKGMYGLKQASVLAYNNLVKNLKDHVYAPIPHTVGLWRHNSRPLTFCLCVDDFGIKYENKADVDHLLAALRQFYSISTDWSVQHFCGFHLDWHYDEGYVDLSMPGYIENVLTKFQRSAPAIPQQTPYHVKPHRPFLPGHRQFVPTPDLSPKLDKSGITRVQSIIGSLLYYARAIVCTLLPALNTIASSQSSPTERTIQECHHLLDYVASHPHTI